MGVLWERWGEGCFVRFLRFLRFARVGVGWGGMRGIGGGGGMFRGGGRRGGCWCGYEWMDGLGVGEV